MGAWRILLEVALGSVCRLCQLLRDGDHGLGGSVAVGWIAGILVECCLCSRRKLAERKGIANERSQVSRKRGPIGIVVRDPLRIPLYPSIQLARCCEELCLCLCPGSKRGR